METVLDLFCGCGGMSWGLHKAGFRVLGGVDMWQPALTTFQLNHPNARAVQADLSQDALEEMMHDIGLQPGELDCLVGGPPCQGLSKNVPAAMRFLQDPRNQLFREFLVWVERLCPRVVIMENVAELYNAYGGSIRIEIVEQLQSLGYQVQVRVLLAADYGVPQMRRRCIFIASRTGIMPHFPQPGFGSQIDATLFGRTEKYRSAWSAISDLPDLENGQGYEPMAYTSAPENEYQLQMRADRQILYDHVTRPLNLKQYSRLAVLEAGQGIKDLPDELRPKSGYSGAYGRLDFEKPAPTITRWVFHPGSGRFGHPLRPRMITIREAARLQSFSDDFRFVGTYIEKAHQLGNAVPPLLMYALAPAIRRCLAA